MTVLTPTVKAAVRESLKAIAATRLTAVPVCDTGSDILLKLGIFRGCPCWLGVRQPVALAPALIDGVTIAFPVLNGLGLDGVLVAGVVTLGCLALIL